MTTQQLNRQWKLLYWEFKHEAETMNKDPKRFFDFVEGKCKRKYLTLYGADREMQYINKNSILIAMVLNRKFSYIQSWQFGIEIDQSIKY
jgi:hypothetical protein